MKTNYKKMLNNKKNSMLFKFKQQKLSLKKKLNINKRD